MNIKYYGLPLFLGRGECFNYCNSIIENLLNYSNEISMEILKDGNILGDVSEKNMVKVLSLENSVLNDRASEKLSIKDYFNIKDKLFNVEGNNIYHCLHNGFSIEEGLEGKLVATIYTTIPLTDGDRVDNEYNLRYMREIKKAGKLCDSIIVPTNFMKEEICNFLGDWDDKIQVIPPGVSSNYIGQSKLLSKAYVLSKYNIREEYYIYVGEINSRNNLIETIKFFKSCRVNKRLKLVLSVWYLNKNKYLLQKLLAFIDKLNLSEDVIFLNKLLLEDKINLINGACCFINLNPIEEINVTQIYAMMLNTKIIAYGNQSNYEYLESYPLYVSDYLEGVEGTLEVLEFVNLTEEDKNNIIYLSKKFDKRIVLEEYLKIYGE